MAKQTAGYLGGFNGKLGPVVGYMWRGVWCMRAHNPFPHNPRTKAQTEHREMFKREVQLAASMRWAVNLGLRDLAYEMHMTAYNLFVHLNQPAFGLEDGAFAVDYSQLRFSAGQRAAVAFGTPQVDEHNVLTVSFGKDNSGLRASAYDSVYLYAYCPDLEDGFMAAPVYRRAKRITVALPDEYAGHELQLYGMVCSDDGQWSETVYVGVGSLELVVGSEELVVGSEAGAVRDADAVHLISTEGDGAPAPGAGDGRGKPK